MSEGIILYSDFDKNLFYFFVDIIASLIFLLISFFIVFNKPLDRLG